MQAVSIKRGCQSASHRVLTEKEEDWVAVVVVKSFYYAVSFTESDPNWDPFVLLACHTNRHNLNPISSQCGILHNNLNFNIVVMLLKY